MAVAAVEISIPSWKIVNGVDGKYTVYDIYVSHDCKQWVVHRRYSECLALHKQLVDQASVNSALFPSAPLLPFGQLSTGFIETRRSELEAYFRAIAPRVLGCPVAESFLGIGNTSIPFKTVYTKNSFLPAVWPPPLLPRYPDQLSVNGSLVFVKALVSTICALIEQTQQIETEIFKAKDMGRRIAVLDNTLTKRKQIVVELESSLATMLDVVQYAPVNPMITDDMIKLNEVGLQAISWLKSIEEQLLSGLDNAASSSNAVPVSLIVSYQKQIEVALALLVACQSDDERKNAIESIIDLERLLIKDIEISNIRNQIEQASQLISLKQYLASSTAMYRSDLASRISESDVVLLEERMFAFIERASQLDSQVDVPDVLKMQAAAQLMNETEQLRADLATTRIALENGRDVSLTNFLNRVSDLQEHLVEIQYRVKTRYLANPVVMHNPFPMPTVVTTTTTNYQPPPNAFAPQPARLNYEFEL